MEQIQKTDAEAIQEEAEAPEVSVEGEVDGGSSLGAAGLQDAISTVAEGFSVRDFKCVKCGIVHGHDTTKHRASDSFDMSEDEASSMKFNPNCHCGVQELGRRGSDYGVDEGDAARTAGSAPIPDETARGMNEQFGAL